MRNIEEKLSERINLPEIKEIAAWTAQSKANCNRMWAHAHSDDRRTGVNALWIMSHLAPTASEWLRSIQNELIDMLLTERDTAKKRLLLQLLREQCFESGSERTDLIDFCLSKINSECEPQAVRAFSIYLASQLCRNYPELLDELREHLAIMQHGQLSPGLKCARRKALDAIERLGA